MAAAESSTSEDRTCPQRHSRSNAINGIEADPWNERDTERGERGGFCGRRRWKHERAVLNREKSWLTLALFTPGNSINLDRFLGSWRMDIVHGIGASSV